MKGEMTERLRDEVDEDVPAPEHVPPLERLNADLKRLAGAMGPAEARMMVSTYYALQEDRKRSGLRRAKAEREGEPMRLVEHFEKQSWFLERQVQKALDLYSAAVPMGQALRAIPGIGPVLSSGLMTWFQVKDRYPEGHEKEGQDRIRSVVGSWWSFAGITPEVEWKKGEKRPYSVEAKTLLYKCGESFVKVQGREGDVYGRLYAERKKYEEANNAAGKYAAEAAKWVTRMHKDSPTQAHYGKGKIPQHHLHARARRWVVKLFLSHFFEYRYRLELGQEPPLPYPIAILGHAHRVESPFPNPLLAAAKPPARKARKPKKEE